MAIEYAMWVEDGLLKVRAWGGQGSLEVIKAYGRAVQDAAQAANVSHVLCDETGLAFSLGTFEAYESARFITEQSNRARMLAIVCRPDQRRMLEFWELVAINRGLHVRIFLCAREAEAWLTGNRCRVAES